MLHYNLDNSTADHRASAALSHYTNNHVMSSPPNHRRGPWSAHEDAYLMSLVQTQGALNWVRISSHLSSRTPKQCRERYHQNLKPSLNHDPITPEEGQLIEQLVQQIGKRWADIARRLSGRSDNAVKNWWNGSQNRRKRQDKRKATSLQYGNQINGASPLLPPMAPASQRQLPLPQAHDVAPRRPFVPPLHPSAMHGANYGIETPMSSPAYSPDSEAAPSLMSDNGSHYGTSPQAPSPPPRYYDARPESAMLAPLKTSLEDGVYPYRTSASPQDNNRLPSLTDATHPINSPDFRLNTSPAFPRNEYPRQPLAYGAPPAAQHSDYFAPRQPHHPLTAPSSPNAAASSFRLSDPGLSASRAEERSNNSRLSVPNLIDPALPL
ncbi:putative Myb-like DNA-binding protein [Triangularia verruculosa]|uniref:Myb-like DNA-binding protein n=1 Tax=Triangularia verruculosa TaxID=2587418 RepID=A0AAN6XDH4_9PEZI|nr:putative Myb-like DNA-binding protein [Triangularia verruculosa]